MASEILAIGTSAASSGDVTIAAGDQLTVCLKDAAGPSIASAARVDVQLKDDSAQYFTIASLSGGQPSIVIIGAGTYRFTRFAGTSCGVFSG